MVPDSTLPSLPIFSLRRSSPSPSLNGPWAEGRSGRSGLVPSFSKAHRRASAQQHPESLRLTFSPQKHLAGASPLPPTEGHQEPGHQPPSTLRGDGRCCYTGGQGFHAGLDPQISMTWVQCDRSGGWGGGQGGQGWQAEPSHLFLLLPSVALTQREFLAPLHLMLSLLWDLWSVGRPAPPAAQCT